MLIVGVTGGIGCGKSLVASMFAELGVTVIDVDQVNRQLSRAGQPCFQAIVQHFGEQVVGADGELNRKLLRQLIFEDAEQRKILESILHPAIYDHCQQQLQQLAQAPSPASSAPYVLILVPLLFEQVHFAKLVQRSLLIDCPESLQIQRVCQRDQISEQQALAIIHAQMSRQQRLSMTDDVIVNDGGLAKLQQQVQQLHQFYLKISK
jgi:dephospho-CoA kinase